MAEIPQFPAFKPVELADRPWIHDVCWEYQPEVSELTFANFFIWRSHHHFHWCMDESYLLIICPSENSEICFAIPPIGPPPRGDISRKILKWMRDEKKIGQPRIERADKRLIEEVQDLPDFIIESTRDHFDYVYQTEDLINLAGRKYHSKRNHINRFMRYYTFRYKTMTRELADECQAMADKWCALKRCADDMNLIGERDAVREALLHFEELQLKGGAIMIGENVEAFSVGELINTNMAVVHIEKANPQIPGLYTVINQQFCENALEQVPLVNREQDMGEPGLRQAKLSYNPFNLVEKFQIRLVV